MYKIKDDVDRLNGIKDYFNEKDDFLRQSGINEYTYEREIYLYENQMPGHEMPIIQHSSGLWFAEPEINNPFRDSDEREQLQKGFDKFLEPEAHSHSRNHEHDHSHER